MAGEYPTNLLDIVNEEDDGIISELKDTYSVPYFRLQDNRWVVQIDNIKKTNELYQDIYRKYQFIISSLSRNIVVVLKYSDVKDLTEREKEFLNISFKEIEIQLPVLAEIEEEISNLSKQKASKDTVVKKSPEGSAVYAKLFYETNENRKYYLAPTEANKLKQKAQEIYSTIKRKAYPQFANSDYLSQK